MVYILEEVKPPESAGDAFVARLVRYCSVRKRGGGGSETKLQLM